MSVILGYIQSCDPALRDRLHVLREAIRQAAPDAVEKISYQMPTFFLHGNLVHFAAFKGHIGFYPGAGGVAAFLPRLDAYHTSKGTIQFPHEASLPLDLVREITRYRVAENIAWYEEKIAKKRKNKT